MLRRCPHTKSLVTNVCAKRQQLFSVSLLYSSPTQNFTQLRSFFAPSQLRFDEKSFKTTTTSNEKASEAETTTLIFEEETTTTTTTSSSSNKKGSSASSKKSKKTNNNNSTEQKSTSDEEAQKTSSSSTSESESTNNNNNNAASSTSETSAEQKGTEKKTTSSSSTEIAPRTPDSAPVVGTVEEYSRVALAGENRLNIIEAQIWHEESCYHPILVKGKQNVYEHTDDIPKEVKPMFGDTQIWQTREYFEYRRKAEDIRYKIFYLGSGLVLFFGLAGAVAFTRIWIDQPNEVSIIRRQLLANSYGRVLELAAGQGINIGIYPFAVTDVVLMDSNPQELHILRSRLPRTAYPTYQVVCDKAEELASFPDNCFDTVVDMFGMCHYRDPVKVLKQMQRVCKPTGSILLLEHGKTKYSVVNWFLDWRAESHFEKTNGCQWNKDLMAIFKEAGLVVRSLETEHYGTTHIVIAHPEVNREAPLMAGGEPAPAIMMTS